MNAEWTRAETWTRRGKGFIVQVNRHEVQLPDSYLGEGKRRWFVYAYIYPRHPHFLAFSGDDMWQDAATVMPMHGGPTLLRWHCGTDGKPTSVQVGADYNHLHDNCYTFFETTDDAWMVFRDADELFEWLLKKRE